METRIVELEEESKVDEVKEGVKSSLRPLSLRGRLPLSCSAQGAMVCWPQRLGSG